MSETENSLQTPAGESPLQQQLADLRRQANLYFMALAVISLCVACFIGIQARRAGKDLETLRPQLAQIQDANKKEAPAIENFMRQLVDYGRTHPDFQDKVLNKYGIKQVPAPVAGAAQPAVAPKK